eukprot:bmy_22506T0
MIESILYARDAWLKEDGVIWPTTAALHLVPCSADRDYRSKVLFWDNAYEFDLSALKSLAIKEFFSKPKYNHILKPEDCLSEPCTILQLDMRTVQIADLEMMKGELHFDIKKAGTLHGFTAWFSVRFQNLEEDEPQLVLSTGPLHPTTHWKQVLFMMDEPVSVLAGDVVTGSVVLQRNPVWRRHMSVTLSWSVTSRQDPGSQKVRYLAVESRAVVPVRAAGWRESLSHLEMTGAALCGMQRLGGTDVTQWSRPWTGTRVLWKPRTCTRMGW